MDKIKVCGVLEIEPNASLTLALDQIEWLVLGLCRFVPPKEDSYLLNRTVFGFERRSEWFGEEKNFLHLPEIELRIFGRSERTLSPYRLRSHHVDYVVTI